jgi:hypothetical protein
MRLLPADALRCMLLLDSRKAPTLLHWSSTCCISGPGYCGFRNSFHECLATWQQRQQGLTKGRNSGCYTLGAAAAAASCTVTAPLLPLLLLCRGLRIVMQQLPHHATCSNHLVKSCCFHQSIVHVA